MPSLHPPTVQSPVLYGGSVTQKTNGVHVCVLKSPFFFSLLFLLLFTPLSHLILLSCSSDICLEFYSKDIMQHSNKIIKKGKTC